MNRKIMILEVLKFNIDSLYYLYGNLLLYVPLEKLEFLNGEVEKMIDSLVEKVEKEIKIT